MSSMTSGQKLWFIGLNNRIPSTMAIEIEKKFLLANDDWRKFVSRSSRYVQGYMGSNRNCSIRVRIEDDEAHLNIKSATLGITRKEYDYVIPVSDAHEILATLCDKPLIEKTRYYVEHQDHTWEIDVFSGENEGLVVAEVELEDADEEISLPDWAGADVSDDPRYYNVCLISNPYKTWQ